MTTQNNADSELDKLLSRINSLTADPHAQASGTAPSGSAGPRTQPPGHPSQSAPNQLDPTRQQPNVEQLQGAPQSPPSAGPAAAPQQLSPAGDAAPSETRHVDPGKPSTIPGVFQDDGVTRNKHEPFVPPEPTSLTEASLTESEVETLVLKFLFARGEMSGRDIAEQICLPFGVLEPVLRALKHEQLVAYKDATKMNDYVYVPTDLGRERARRYMQDCSYFGSATVSLEDYIHSVKEQSLTFQNPSRADLQEAFSDLLINQKMFNRLGPAINSGRGMFLFGFPRKRERRVSQSGSRKCFGKYIYVPRAIGLNGESHPRL